MRILSQQELEVLEGDLKEIGRRAERNVEAHRQIDSLMVGQSLLIKKEEWEGKSSPASYASKLLKESRGQKKFQVRVFKDEAGWIVIRKV